MFIIKTMVNSGNQLAVKGLIIDTGDMGVNGGTGFR